MRVFAKIAPLFFAALAAASPIDKRQLVSSDGLNDAQILQYALTLEHLEAAFYSEGLKMFNAGAFEDASFPEWVRLRFTEIANHEQTHVTFLSTALKAAGVTPVGAGTYEFGNTSPQTFLAIAQILEEVGVSAYLGAAPSITNKAYLSVAGSILVVEAEHGSWVRAAADNLDAFPTPFATPLDFNQVYTLASGFIKSLPSSPSLPLKAFPAITVNTKGPYKAGQKISITQPKGLSGKVYAAFIQEAGTQFVLLNSTTSEITIPKGVMGQSYLILTNGPGITDKYTVAGPAIVPVDSPATLYSY